MAAFLDNCRFNPTLGGLTDWTYSSAVASYQSPASANAVNGRLYKYFAIDASNNWELGEGAWNSGTLVLARTTIVASSTGSKINFAAAPTVAVVALKEDMISIEEANSFTTTQQGQARKNIAAFGVVVKQLFTSSGTYTPSANLLYAIVECQGGGGGGGGVTSASGGVNGGGGGGAGSYSKGLLTAAAIGSSQTVTIGAGGAGSVGTATATSGSSTSVGTLVVSNGGAGGVGGTTLGATGIAGVGGAAGTGNMIASTGENGKGSILASVNIFNSVNFGGSTAYGGGGVTPAPNNGTVNNGTAATGFGAGGGGASFVSVASLTGTGGAGSPGFVLITEFCAA